MQNAYILNIYAYILYFHIDILTSDLRILSSLHQNSDQILFILDQLVTVWALQIIITHGLITGVKSCDKWK